MRISTLHIFNLANNSMTDTNKAIYKTQEELSTGKKILSAAEDPVTAIRANQLNSYLATLEQYEKNTTFAENSLSLEESSLNSANNLLQRMEELAVQAGNTAVLSPNDYQAIASEVESRMGELVSLMNTQNSGGDYIFGGYKSEAPPFIGDITNGYQYVGDEGQLSIKVDDNTFVAASDSGKELFINVPSANNTARSSVANSNRSEPSISITPPTVVDQTAYDDFYPEDIIVTFNEDADVAPAGKNFTITERSSGKVLEANHLFVSGEEITIEGLSFRITGNPSSADTGAGNGDQLFVDSSNSQDTLTTLQQFYNAMMDYDGSASSRETLESVVASTINNIGNAQENVNKTITSIGSRMNTLESVKDFHVDAELVSREILSDLIDTDYAEAASRLSAQTLILQAAQASFLTIKDLSLISQL